MEFEVPRRRIARPTLSIDMVQRVYFAMEEATEVCFGRKRPRPMAKEYCYNNNKPIKILFGEEKMKTREDKRMVEFEFFQNFPFWTYSKKINAFTFGAWSFLVVHIRFTPSERPKGFVN